MPASDEHFTRRLPTSDEYLAQRLAPIHSRPKTVACSARSATPANAECWRSDPRGLAMIREALERAFDIDATLVTVEAIVQAICDAAADQPRPASRPAESRTHFQYRLDRWDARRFIR
jgi:hypothetical protein